MSLSKRLRKDTSGDECRWIVYWLLCEFYPTDETSSFVCDQAPARRVFIEIWSSFPKSLSCVNAQASPINNYRTNHLAGRFVSWRLRRLLWKRSSLITEARCKLKVEYFGQADNSIQRKSDGWLRTEGEMQIAEQSVRSLLERSQKMATFIVDLIPIYFIPRGATR
jgi:hypothetical protein